MKKQVIFLLTVLSVLLVLAGCGKEELPAVTTGDFRMDVPNGYTITDICDTKCTIMKGETAVGGIMLTQLTEKTGKTICRSIWILLQEQMSSTNISVGML